jgi:hypothetical protein
MTNRIIIAFGGLPEHGKSSCAREAQRMISDTRVLAFGTALKEVLKPLLRLSHTSLYTTTGKETPQPHLNGMTPRRALRIFGTDIGRDLMPKLFPELDFLRDKSIWVWQVEQDILESKKEIFIIEDMRFPDEEKMLESLATLFIPIKVVRPGYDTGSTHRSDTQELEFKHTIINDGSIDKMFGELHHILENYPQLKNHFI